MPQSIAHTIPTWHSPSRFFITLTNMAQALPNPRLQAKKWWHAATVYQIYPASFKDSDGDGVGDLRGIISKVDYIASLGVDAVWLSPCFLSPRVDQGYDISDYCAIDPMFGTMEDMETLIAKLKEHNIRLLMDLVVNHTSSQHPWFLESRSSRDSTMRDWYIWRPPTKLLDDAGQEVGFGPPNNWESQFKGSAWEYDEATQEYYLRIFSKDQPDLNWDQPDVRFEIYDMMHFWLQKGIGGFRMDVINMISKPNWFPDAVVTNPNSTFASATNLYSNGPRVHMYLTEMYKEVLSKYPDIVAIGETPNTDEIAEVRRYVELGRRELNMALQFDLMAFDHGIDPDGGSGKFFAGTRSLGDLKRRIVKWQTSLSFSSGAWQAFFFETHDTARSVSRFGDNTAKNRFKAAKMLALLQMTIQGTAFIHQGQEIGMANLAHDIPIEQYSDIETKAFLQVIWAKRQAQAIAEGKDEVYMDDVVGQVRLKARDHGRMPMPWDASKRHAGFSDADGDHPLWTLMNSDAEACDVNRQEHEPHSVLNYWRHVIGLRKKYQGILVFGDFVPVLVDESPIFAYFRRSLPGDRGNMLVVINMTAQERVWFRLPQVPRQNGHMTDTEFRQVHSCWRGDFEDVSAEANKWWSGDTMLLTEYEGFVLAFS